jgi:CRP/FNR family cyclic AMP-dependent transcriptional regulator
MSGPLLLRLGRDFSAGNVLFREGEHRGEFLGEMAILNGKPRTATAVVLEDAKCLVIDAATLEHMIANNAEIALRLVKKLARRLDSADEMIQILLNPDPKARVLHGLKRHAETFGTPTGPDGSLRVNVSSEGLAREVGVESAQVHDVLSRLRRLRIATEDETGDILVTDLTRLLEFMEFLEMPQRFEG